MRRFVVRVGLGLCLVLAGAWLASFRWGLDYFRNEPHDLLHVHLDSGNLSAFREDLVVHEEDGWRISPPPLGLRDLYWARWRPSLRIEPGFVFVRLPLWIPLLTILSAITVLWLAEARYRQPGHCRACGYDLTGNTSGVCPEGGLSIWNGRDPKNAI